MGHKFTANAVFFCLFFFFCFFQLISLVIHLALITNRTHPVVQRANSPFFFCLFVWFWRWFTISTDGGQQNCKLASSRIQDAETRACWQWLVSVYPMSLLIFLKRWSLDQLTIKPCDTFWRRIRYCPMQGEKLVRNIPDVKNRDPNMIPTYNTWTYDWCRMGQDFSKEELILDQS